jgi:poly(A) polymerase
MSLNMQTLLNSPASNIIKIINKTSHSARFIGGAVRDSILNQDNINDSLDIDIATTMPPNEVINLFAEHSYKAIPIGIKFGTVTVVIDGKGYEITTLRKDIRCDGRHAEVEFTDNWKVDASRRDFTINAMSLDLDGSLYDYFGGVNDLSQGIVRFIGDPEQRIKEDYLRILRFFRFCGRYTDQFDQASLEACLKLAPLMKSLSVERIEHEVCKTLITKNILLILPYLDQVGNFIQLTPTLDVTKFQQLLKLEKLISSVHSHIFITHHIERRLFILNKGILPNWNLSNKIKNIFTLIWQNLTYDSLIKLVYAVGKDLAINVSLLSGVIFNKDMDQVLAEVIAIHSMHIPPFPINGNDIAKLFNITQGKELGHILNNAKQYWLEHKCSPHKEQILRYVADIIKQRG